MKTQKTETPTAVKKAAKGDGRLEQLRLLIRDLGHLPSLSSCLDGVQEYLVERIELSEIACCQTNLVRELIDSDALDGFDWEHVTVPLDLPVDILETVEWWFVTSWLASQLTDNGEIVIANQYGHWWGSRHSQLQSYSRSSLETVARQMMTQRNAMRIQG